MFEPHDEQLGDVIKRHFSNNMPCYAGGTGGLTKMFFSSAHCEIQVTTVRAAHDLFALLSIP